MTTLNRSALLEVPAETAYRVVADVERYPEFVPGCDRVAILDSDAGQPGRQLVQVTVSGKGLAHTFVTANRLEPDQILMSLKEGPFRRLEGAWRFKAIGQVGCRVEVTLQFEAAGLLGRMLSLLANTVADVVVDAFSRRIVQVHGQSACESK